MASKKSTTAATVSSEAVASALVDVMIEAGKSPIPELPTRKPGLKILAFGAENIKRLKVVQIHPKSNVVQIAGENESGKSSVLDSIEWALCGTSTLPSQPIRKGEATGKIQVHLAGDDANEYKITRFFNKAGNKLQIEGRNREMFKTPQSLLDGLMGKISFDPLAFIKMKPKEQLETLRSLVTVEVDIPQIDADYKAMYDDRRAIGRDIDALAAREKALPSYEGIPEEPIDTAALTMKLQEASTHNAMVEGRKREVMNLQEEAARRQLRAAHNTRRINEMQEEMNRLAEEAAELLRESHQQAEAAEKVLAGIAAPIDTAQVAQELTAATATNQQIEKNKQKAGLQAEIVEKQEQFMSVDFEMESNRKMRNGAIANAKMPIVGLNFGEGEVVYNELPFDQASNAVQIRVSVALAMASNPTIRVLRIKDGSLLDDKNMAIIAEMAEANDYQVWIERVESSGPMGIVMVDGEATGEEAS